VVEERHLLAVVEVLVVVVVHFLEKVGLAVVEEFVVGLAVVEEFVVE